MSLLTFLLVISFVGFFSAEIVNVTVQNPIGTIPDTFVSFNSDWWPTTKPGWGHAGLLNLDLSNPLLISLTKALAPANWRLGGTLADTIIYEIGPHEPCVQGNNCLNITRLNQIISFTSQTGIGLVFGLNENYGRSTKGAWDPTNTENLLAYFAKNNLKVYGWELGNELQGHLSPSTTASDYRVLRQLIDKYWPDSTNRPKLIGPDPSGDAPWFSQFVSLTKGVVDVYTYHHYNAFGGNPTLPQRIVTPEFLDNSISTAAIWENATFSVDPQTELWLGEGAAAYDSGQSDTTNAFISGFFYLNALGTLAQHRHTAFQRQALVGGWYELINKTTFTPNPDYFTAYIWKKLVGSKVLSTMVQGVSDLKFYSHCAASSAPGLLTTIFINVNHNSSYELRISGVEVLYPRYEYVLTAPEGNLRTQASLLNGKLLQLENNQLPNILPKIVKDNAPVIVPPLSYGFIVFPKNTYC